MTGEGAHAGKLAQQRAVSRPGHASMRHEGAQVRRGQAGKGRQVWRVAEMFGEKADELPQVAGIGLDRQ